MILIAHRGNTTGPNPSRENHPDYIDEAIKKGYDVEVDIWYNGDVDECEFKLGHDTPRYNVDWEWLVDDMRVDRLWLHCKNVWALQELTYRRSIRRRGSYLNFFAHERDTVAMTSNGYLWWTPGHHNMPGYQDKYNKRPGGIAAMPPMGMNLKYFSGICSDDIAFWENIDWRTK